MNTSKPSAKSKPVSGGFTLIETLLALSPAALVPMGVYSMFSGAFNTNRALDGTNNDLIIREAIQKLISKDIRMMHSVDNATSDPNKRLIAIKTQNSLGFNKAFPVSVLYEVDNETLFRREFDNQTSFDMRMPLLQNVSEWKVQSFNGSEYKDGFDIRSNIYKFHIVFDNRTVDFTTGRAVEPGR